MNGHINKPTKHLGGLKSIDDFENKYVRVFWRIVAAVLGLAGKIIVAIGTLFVALFAAGSQSDSDEHEYKEYEKKQRRVVRDWNDPNDPTNPDSLFYDPNL